MKNQKKRARRGAGKAKATRRRPCRCSESYREAAGVVNEHHPSCDWYEPPSEAHREIERLLGIRRDLEEANQRLMIEGCRVAEENAQLRSIDPEKETHTVILGLLTRLRSYNLSEPTIRFIIGHCLDLTFDYYRENPEAPPLVLSTPAPSAASAPAAVEMEAEEDPDDGKVVYITVRDRNGNPVEFTAGLIGTIAK